MAEWKRTRSLELGRVNWNLGSSRATLDKLFNLEASFVKWSNSTCIGEKT